LRDFKKNEIYRKEEKSEKPVKSPLDIINKEKGNKYDNIY